MPKIRSILSVAVLFISWLAGGSSYAELPRFEAMLANGQRLQGRRFENWHQRAGMPHLDGKQLLNEGNPLLWLRDRYLQPGPRPESFVEMISGDRLPCEVLGYDSGGSPTQWESLPPHFIVRPTVNVSPPHGSPHSTLRIVRRFVRRIVWQSRPGDETYQPGTLFYKDGRTVKFRAARFSASQVRLLQTADQLTVPYREISQLHLPAEDPWESYYDELAVLSPTGEHRLLQIDSTEGATVTGSLLQFTITNRGNASDSDNWFHAVQPAWCLEPIWTRNNKIWMRRCWSREQVPLSHIPPSNSVSRSIVAQGERSWRRNMNSSRRALEANDQSHGWGYGVHAYSELQFDLPTLVKGFRTRVALDDAVNSGGCIIARVYAGTVDTQPLFQSPHIVGSQSVRDTQNINLASLSEDRRRLILQVDPAHKGRPAKSDPFDIRDMADWLDPTVTLDREKLLTEIAARVPSRVPAFEGWHVGQVADGDYKWVSDSQRDGAQDPGRFYPQVFARNKPLKLSRRLTVDDDDQWLMLSAYRRRGESQQPELLVRIDGIDVAAASIPLRSSERLPAPVVVSLAPYIGHTIHLEVLQLPTAEPGFPAVFWHGIKVCSQLPILYRAVEDDARLEVIGPEKVKTQFTDQDQHSGERSLSIAQGGQVRIAFDEPILIRGNPRFGQHRFFRIATRKFGGGEWRIELQQADRRRPRVIYTAGKPLNEKKSDQDDDQPSGIKEKSVWNLEMPDEWIVTTRDVYSDFGDLDITALVLHVPDGQQALFDHIYFASGGEHFDLLPQVPSPEATNTQARRELARTVLDKGHPATVAVLIDGRQATGVLVEGDGYVLTAGHVLGSPNKDCEIQLTAGQRMPAKTRGIFRGADLGLVQITDRKDTHLPGLALNPDKQFPADRLYVGFALEPFVEETPGAEAHIVGIQRDFPEALWTDFRLPQATTGGPLLDREGRIIGTQIRDSRFGGFLYTKSFVAREHWDRLKKGEIWGEWFPGAGPMLGVIIGDSPNGAKVLEVFVDSPAEQAGVQVGDILRILAGERIATLEDVYRTLAAQDPGDDVATEFTRRGQKLSKKIKLTPRMP